MPNALLRKLLISQRYMDAAAEDGPKSGGADKIAAALAEQDAAAKAAAAEAETKKAEEAAAAEAAKKGEPSGEKKPTDEEAKLLKDVMQKKAKLQESETALAEAREQLKRFEGIDPEAVRALLKEKSDAETAALEAKGEWSRLKERMAAEHSTEKQSLESRIAELQSALSARDGQINELTIGTQFSASQFINNELALTPAKARVIYGEHFELVDGKVVGYDKPKSAASRTPIVDASGNTLSFDEALKKIIDADPEKDFLLKSKVKAGAGSASTVPAGKQAGVTKTDAEAKGVSRIASGLKGLNIQLN
jgi:hypothetical protein